jgi:hypothetical protein
VSAISKFIVRVADLVEAEGRVLRREVVTIGILLVTALGAAMTALGGAAMLVVALFLSLSPAAGPAWAATICGAVLLCAAGGLAWLVNRRR